MRLGIIDEVMPLHGFNQASVVTFRQTSDGRQSSMAILDVLQTVIWSRTEYAAIQSPRFTGQVHGRPRNRQRLPSASVSPERAAQAAFRPGHLMQSEARSSVEATEISAPSSRHGLRAGRWRFPH